MSLLEWQDITKLKLIERKELLKGILPESDIIKYCDHVEEDGVYSGEVGTGFTNELLKSLHKKIQPLEVDKCPLNTPMKKKKDFIG